ncbi:hypothetical protein [Marinoscillum pacificum]|uniref:hypothetical protein n=1 Tax=Marinoscillum pacificum TaxID=392723 RepID=UPI002157F522|nr:hypothetical protein [Marinoscillum pacificum]
MIWTALNIILIIALALSFQPEEGPTKHYWFGLLAKFAASIAFGLYYFTYLQSGDTVAFHEKAFELFQLSEQSFNQYISYLFTGHHPVYMAEGRNDFFVKILSIPYVATQGNYWISALYLAFFSFLCSWFLFRSVVGHYPKLLIPAFIAFLLWPTSLFWSSGAMKDTLVNGSVFFLAAVCIRYKFGFSFRFSQVTVAILCLAMLFYMKFYLAALMGISMGLLAWDKLASTFIEKKSIRMISGIAALVILIALTSQLNWNMNLDKLPGAITENYERMKNLSEDNEIIQFDLDGTYSSLIKNIPHSLYTGLFRPAIWQTNSWMIFFGLESLFIYLLVIQNGIFFKQISINQLGTLALFFCIALATLLPMASPNLGSLVRYKSAFMPFLMFLLLVAPYQGLFLKKKESN